MPVVVHQHILATRAGPTGQQFHVLEPVILCVTAFQSGRFGRLPGDGINGDGPEQKPAQQREYRNEEDLFHVGPRVVYNRPVV
jgi:hypothetical protein